MKKSFVETTAFTIILFSAALVLGAVGILGGIEALSMLGLVAGFGAVAHLLVMHF